MRLGSRGRLALAAAALGLVGAQAIASPAAGRPLADDGYGKDSWWYQAMGLAEAHKISTGKGVTIAVIDGPIDLSVPELKGQDVKAVKSFCSNKPTGTGAIANHATSVVVNIIGNGKGTTAGGVGVAGVAPDATVRTYSVDDSAREGLQCTADPGDRLGEAIDAAVNDGAQIINLSVGGPTSTKQLDEALLQALQRDVVVVAAAGNGPEDKAVNYPAAYPGVVAVAAVDRHAQPWKNNVEGNREAFVISAAGVDLQTGGFDGNRWRSDARADGTSGAAPLVAGGLALVRAKYPDASANQLIQHLIHNPGGTRTFGKDLETGYGVISVPKLLASDPTRWPDVNPLVAGEAAATPDGSATAGQVNGTPVSAAGEADEGGSSMGLLASGLGLLIVVGAAAAFILSRRRSAVGGGHG